MTALHKLHSEVCEVHVASPSPANVPTGSWEGGREVVMYIVHTIAVSVSEASMSNR